MTDKQMMIDGVDITKLDFQQVFFMNSSEVCGLLLKTIQEYICKTQECEELKKTIMYKCPQCGEEYLSPIGASLYEENNKLKRALAEIKELIQSDYCTEIGSCEFCAEIGNCLNRKILQKISEVVE